MPRFVILTWDEKSEIINFKIVRDEIHAEIKIFESLELAMEWVDYNDFAIETYFKVVDL